MIIRSLVFALASLCTVATCSIAQAAIVLTPVRTSLPTSTNVTINLYARWDGNLSGGVPSPILNSSKVGAYNFRVNITGGTVTGLAAQHTTNPGSVWSGVTPFAAFPVGSPAISGQQIEWRAANTSAVSPIAIPNVTLTSANNLSTLLGTIQFNAPIGTYTFTFTGINSPDYNINGFGFINSNGPNDQFSHSLASPPISISVTAVPEPSTLALCALSGVILPIRRFFRKRAAV